MDQPCLDMTNICLLASLSQRLRAIVKTVKKSITLAGAAPYKPRK